MTALQDFQAFVRDAEAGAQFAAWKRDNPNDYGRWATVRDLTLQGRLPAWPVMQTAHGRELLDGARLYWDAQVVPPAPTPTSGWDDAIAYTKTRAPFSMLRYVPVVSLSELLAALAGLQAGDRIIATQPFTIAQKLDVIGHKVASPAVIDLLACKFTGYTTITPGMPCVYFTGNRNVFMYVDEMTNPGGNSGCMFFNSDSCAFYANKIHDTGGDSISVQGGGGPVNNCDVYVADASNWEIEIAGDPHAEKGTGGHGCQFGDAGYPVTNTRFAMYAHDGPHGSALQYGASGTATTGNTIALKAERLNMVSTSQVSGNGVNLWGADPVSATFTYLEVNDAQGYAMSVDNEYGADFSKVTVKVGRSARTQKNPRWQGGPTFQPGPTYQDVVAA